MLVLQDYITTYDASRIIVNDVFDVKILGENDVEQQKRLINELVLTDLSTPRPGESALKTIGQELAEYISSKGIFTDGSVKYSCLAVYNINEDQAERVFVSPSGETTELIARNIEQRVYTLRITFYDYIETRNDARLDKDLYRLEKLIDALRDIVITVEKFKYYVTNISIDEAFDAEQYELNFVFVSSLELAIQRFK